MKIRYWLIVIIIIIITGSIYSVKIINDNYEKSIDMVQINDEFVQIKKKLDISTLDKITRDDIENQYQCELIYRSDEEYESFFMNAVKNQKIILDYERDNIIAAKVIFPGTQDQLKNLYLNIKRVVLMIFFIVMMIICGVLLMIYCQYIRPFKRLQEFASCVSKGNFDFPLPMEKNNYFGAFTESFDLMRVELKRARQSEFEAEKSKKELVASLSHDIKTPVATIKAICEILMLKIKDEVTLEKIVVINQKAGMIDDLISNMFHATLQDLEVLKIAPAEEISTDIIEMFVEINHYNKIHFINDIPQCIVIIDKLRMNQVIDNIINNSYKYANTDIDVLFEKQDKELIIIIKDYGNGIDSEELPLVFEKFYRGKNIGKNSGSGLGLYLTQTFMQGMGGNIKLENDNGLKVTLSIRIA